MMEQSEDASTSENEYEYEYDDVETEVGSASSQITLFQAALALNVPHISN